MAAYVRKISGKRGDLVIAIEKLGFHLSGMTGSERRHRIGVVTNQTRDGHIKGIRFAGDSYVSRIEQLGPRVIESFKVIPRDEIDADAAMEMAANHTYKTDPRVVAPFDSLHEVREALRPFLQEVAR